MARLLALLALLPAGPSPGSAAAASTHKFGFSGPEIYPIDSQISQLHVADLDGDGLNDLIVVNNARSKINLLYNRTGKTNSPPVPVSGSKIELNELPADARFEIRSIPSESRISALIVADLNGDGRPDLAYYGEPRELVVLYNEGTNGWSAPKRWSIEDGQLSVNSLCSGDLNGDGRTDLVLLGDNSIYYLPQGADHALGEPERIPFSGVVKSVQVLDVNGDGLADLLLVNWEDRHPFRFRLQKPGGFLGPEIFFESTPIRSYWADNLEASKQIQIVTILQNSGRAQLSEFTRRPAEPLSADFRQGQFQVLPLNRTDKARRGVVWADVDGDGLADLLVAEPESGQISLFLQKPDGSLGPPRAFPTLAGITDIAVADWEGDGHADIFTLSEDERQVGVTRLDPNGRLPFPTLLPFDGRPLAFAVGPLQPQAKPTLAVIIDQDGHRSLVTRMSGGVPKTQRLNDSFKLKPAAIAFHDADQDGLVDLVVLIPYEKVKILRQVANQDFQEIDVAPPGGLLDQPWLGAADVDGDGKPELLLTQKNFVRAVVLRAAAEPAASTNRDAWTFIVKEQINGAASNSRLIGAAALPRAASQVPAVFLLDAELKVLTLCERNPSGLWQIARNLPLPASEFTGLGSLALGGGQPNTVAFYGLNAVAWMALGGLTWQLTELDTYETPIKDGHLNDVVSGDLDNDGRKELVFLETARNYLDLVTISQQHKLVPANRWQVFEERTFRNRRSDLPEPREAVVADVTGDGKNDLIVLVHDRIIVYPQE